MYGMVSSIMRANASGFGNPNWDFLVVGEDGEFHRFRTSANIMQSYEAGSWMEGKFFTFTFTRAGRVTGWTLDA